MGKKGKGKGKGGCVELEPLRRRARRWTFPLMVAVSIAATSCTPLRDVIWPTTVKCLTTPASALVAEVRTIVERDGLDAVFSAASVDALEDLARSYGPEAVVCVIKELIDAYTAPTGMQAPPDRLAAARRAQDFLNERDIVVQEASP